MNNVLTPIKGAQQTSEYFWFLWQIKAVDYTITSLFLLAEQTFAETLLGS